MPDAPDRLKLWIWLLLAVWAAAGGAGIVADEQTRNGGGDPAQLEDQKDKDRLAEIRGLLQKSESGPEETERFPLKLFVTGEFGGIEDVSHPRAVDPDSGRPWGKGRVVSKLRDARTVLIFQRNGGALDFHFVQIDTPARQRFVRRRVEIPRAEEDALRALPDGGRALADAKRDAEEKLFVEVCLAVMEETDGRVTVAECLWRMFQVCFAVHALSFAAVWCIGVFWLQEGWEAFVWILYLSFVCYGLSILMLSLATLGGAPNFVWSLALVGAVSAIHLPALIRVSRRLVWNKAVDVAEKLSSQAVGNRGNKVIIETVFRRVTLTGRKAGAYWTIQLAMIVAQYVGFVSYAILTLHF